LPTEAHHPGKISGKLSEAEAVLAQGRHGRRAVPPGCLQRAVMASPRVVDARMIGQIILAQKKRKDITT